MAIKKRCLRCLQVVRADGTCQNHKCAKYVLKPEEKPAEEQEEKK